MRSSAFRPRVTMTFITLSFGLLALLCVFSENFELLEEPFPGLTLPGIAFFAWTSLLLFFQDMMGHTQKSRTEILLSSALWALVLVAIALAPVFLRQGLGLSADDALMRWLEFVVYGLMFNLAKFFSVGVGFFLGIWLAK